MDKQKAPSGRTEGGLVSLVPDDGAEL